MTDKKIYTLNKKQPHPSYKGWRNFLKNHCEKVRTERKVEFYRATNCNYILFPCGLLFENYGYHGNALMNEIKEKGIRKVKKEILDIHEEIQKALKKIDNLMEKK
jgi:hypothetical protein